MKILFFFYLKFFKSLIICFSTCLIIFFIFSLLGNLGENLSFLNILYVSSINTFQILANIPSMITILTIILFVIFLRSKNELMIIKEYLTINKFIMIILPLAFFFTFIEINKNLYSNNLEKLKSNFLNLDNNLETKVVIEKFKDFVSYIILKEVRLSEGYIKEFHRYEIEGNEIKIGEYSDDITIHNGMLITNNYTKFEKSKITNKKDKNIILDDASKLNKSELIIINSSENKKFIIDFDNLNKFVYLIFFYLTIFLILFNKKVIDRKENIIFPIFITFLLLIYFTIVTSIKLVMYNLVIQILALIFIILIFYRIYKYE